MGSNITNVGGSFNVSQPYNSTHVSVQGHQWRSDPGNNLGYGVGRGLRMAFDYLHSAWQKMWTPKPSAEALALKRQVTIYRQSLKRCVRQLGPFLINIQRNSKDPNALKEIASLASGYAMFLKPSEKEEIRKCQSKVLKPLEERVKKLADLGVKNKIKELLPILFQEPAASEEGNLLLTDRHKLSVVEAVPKSKRSLQQTDGFSSPLDLNALNKTTGLVVDGLIGGRNGGPVVRAVGDFDDDGIPDIAIGVPSASPDGLTEAGIVYICFGPLGGWPSQFDPNNPNGVSCIVIKGLAALDRLGSSIATGDVNGDGIPDVIIGVPYASPDGLSQAGQVIVLYGKKGPWLSPFSLSTLDSTQGYVIKGIIQSGLLGSSVATGDFNGNGIVDILMGAPNSVSAGSVFMLFGQKGLRLSPVNLNLLDGTDGVVFTSSGEYLGNFVSSAGDFDGDRIEDILMADEFANLYDGKVVLVCGKLVWQSPFNLNLLSAADGIEFPGICCQGQLGHSVSSGDFNGDGKSDILMGIPFIPNGGAYMVFGHERPWSSPVDLSSPNGNTVVEFRNPNSGVNLGMSVSTAGDFDGNGIADILLGDHKTNGNSLNESGEAYIVLGHNGTWQPSFDVSKKNGTDVIVVPGLAEGDHLGVFVGTGGDLRGNGASSVILVSSKVDLTTGNPLSAKAYFVFGKDASVNPLTPTPTPTPNPTIPTVSLIPTPTPTPTIPSPSVKPAVQIIVTVPQNITVDSFIPITPNDVNISNNTVNIRLVDTDGYEVVYTANHTAFPTNQWVDPEVVTTQLSWRRGTANPEEGDAPVFEGCDEAMECELSQTPFRPVFGLGEDNTLVYIAVGVGAGAVVLTGVAAAVALTNKKLRERLFPYRDRGYND